jgi:putative toxin-antitoxin system antitoxin component (TIGR02293 family)
MGNEMATSSPSEQQNIASACNDTTQPFLNNFCLTGHLIQNDPQDLSAVRIYGRIVEGFALREVQAMLEASVPSSAKRILSRITGCSVRTIQRRIANNEPQRLTPQQSAVAFQYAKVIEVAISVFGTPYLAEEWLRSPCRYLEWHLPLEMAENSLGSQIVEAYLERIKYGVYQ